MQVPLLDLKAQYATIKEEIKAVVVEVFENQQFVLGPNVKALEEEIAAYCQTKFAVGVASGTDALLLSLMSIGVGYGDEVITTTYTFFATAGSISRLGARPVFIDIDSKTYNIDPKKIEEFIENKCEFDTKTNQLINISTKQPIKAIIPVHLYGQCAEMDAIMQIAEKYKLFVIEDAAQAIGAEYKNKRAGSIGDLGCFSFFPSKNLGGAGDGGMVVTNNETLAEKIRLLRVHGGQKAYHYSVVGANSRLDALQAALLRVKLKYLDDWSEKRCQHAQFYNKQFKDTGIITPFIEEYNKSIYNQYIIRLKNRDNLEKYLKENQIGCAIYYPLPLHMQECFQSLGYKPGDLPESEKAAKETISIPVYPELAAEQQDYVVEKIKKFTNY